MKYQSKNEKETIKIVKQFAKTLSGGEMILFYGNLGSGKTFFIRELVNALGIKESVKSPTFNIMKCYRIFKSSQFSVKGFFCHIDTYRLNNLNDLLDIGLLDFINNNTIIAIEWADRVMGIEKMGKKIIKIKIDYGKTKTERKIDIKM